MISIYVPCVESYVLCRIHPSSLLPHNCGDDDGPHRIATPADPESGSAQEGWSHARHARWRNALPSFAGQKTYATTSSDDDGRFELQANLTPLQCESTLVLEATRGGYAQGLDYLECGRATVTLELWPLVTSIRIEPEGASSAVGETLELTATATLADGVATTDPSRFYWDVSGPGSGTETCGFLDVDPMSPSGNPVAYTAPAVPPGDACAEEGDDQGKSRASGSRNPGSTGSPSRTSVARSSRAVPSAW